ncbi:hypothetical protein QMK33_15345 [Hymenobacter sp. H14-R3]|uniref:hypothetical protein n=1 Tax=Hymenobacter sp. H14-R3 TaxID=3046308 RepID=UPI0024B988AA|nr:hypothetical protein [Hymenobacter sp. H14-R3]MDJ0366533.1 hypothetical protein [Hymenobacter sp. H14-R3]
MAFGYLEHGVVDPALPLAEFVRNFWMLANPSAVEQPVVLVPDGRIDRFFGYSAAEPYHVTLLGLQDRPEAQVIASHSTLFAPIGIRAGAVFVKCEPPGKGRGAELLK